MQIGKILLRSPEINSLSNNDCLAVIQFRLPLRVLISPLWAMSRYGCARLQEGKVLVENLEWTSAIALDRSGSERSAKYSVTWGVVSIPLKTKVRPDSDGK